MTLTLSLKSKASLIYCKFVIALKHVKSLSKAMSTDLLTCNVCVKDTVFVHIICRAFDFPGFILFWVFEIFQVLNLYLDYLFCTINLIFRDFPYPHLNSMTFQAWKMKS